MSPRISLTSLVLLSALLTACGGGGGGSDSGGGTDPTTTTTTPQPPKTIPGDGGSNTINPISVRHDAAALSTNNAASIAGQYETYVAYIQAIADPNYDSSVTSASEGSVWAMSGISIGLAPHLSPETSIDLTSTSGTKLCSGGGTMTVTTQTDSSTSNTVSAVFDQCIDGTVTYNGTKILRSEQINSQTQQAHHQVVTYRGLRITGPASDVILNGYVTIDLDSTETVKRLAFNASLTDAKNLVEYEADDLTLTMPIGSNVDSNLAYHYSVSGKFTQSQYGYVTLSGGGNTDSIKLVGAGGANIRLSETDVGGTTERELQLDANGDGQTDANMTATWAQAFNTYPNSTAPVAAASSPDATPVTDSAIALDATGSHDSDSGLLTYNWTLLSAPSGANYTLNDGSSAQASFQTDTAGEYQFQVLVYDGEHTSTQTVTVDVSNALHLTVSGNDSVNWGDSYAATSATTGQGATPVVYSLAAGPAGMTVNSSTGDVSWTANNLHFNRQTTVHFTVRATAGNATTTMTMTRDITVNPPSQNQQYARSTIEGPNLYAHRVLSVADMDGDNKAEIVVNADNGSAYALSRQNDDSYKVSWQDPFARQQAAENPAYLQVIAKDINGNHKAEIFRAYPNEIQRLDDSGGMVAATWTAADNSPPIQDMAIADVDGDGTEDLVLIQGDGTNKTGALRVLNASTLQQEWSVENINPGTALLIANIDKDSAQEIITGSGTVYDGITHQSEWVSNTAFGNLLAAGDVLGDGTIDIVGGDRNSTQLTVFSPTDQKAVLALSTNALCALDVANIIDTSSSSSGDSGSGAGSDSANHTEQDYDEILQGDCAPSSNLHIFDIVSDKAKALATYLGTAKSAVTTITTGKIAGDSATKILWTDSKGILRIGSIENNSVTVASKLQGQEEGIYAGGLTAKDANLDYKLYFSGWNGTGYQARVLTMDPATADIQQFDLADATDTHYASFGSACLADTSGQGYPDLIVPGYTNGTYAVSKWHLGDDDISNLLGAGNLFPPVISGCGDLNGDGYTDIGFVHDGNKLEIYDSADNKALFTGTFDKTVSTTSWDVNGDHQNDLVVLSNQKLSIYLNDNGSFTFSRTIDDPAGSYFRRAGMLVVDADGDGTKDLVTYGLEGDNHRVIVMNTSFDVIADYEFAGDIRALANSPLNVNGSHAVLIAGGSETQSTTEIEGNSQLFGLDAMTGNIVWDGPIVDGNIESVAPVDAAIGPAAGIAVGTDKAMLLLH